MDQQKNPRPGPAREDQDLVPNDPQVDPADLTPTRLPNDPDPYDDAEVADDSTPGRGDSQVEP